MKKYLFILFSIVIILFTSNSCLALSEEQKKDYGLLESAVTFSSDKVIGEYGDRIPNDFNGKKFLLVVKDKIPEDYYQALMKHQLDVTPKGSYYLLLIFESGQLVLFDYSCTPEVDGPVLLEPKKYDLDHLALYDTCRNNETELRSEESLLTISEAVWTSGIDNMKNPKQIYEETTSGVRQLYLWMHIRGQERALEVLDSQGKLPIQHLWIYSTGISQVDAGSPKPIDAIDLTVGKKDKLSKLRLEVKKRGFFDWRTWSMKKNITKGGWLVKLLYADGSPVLCDDKPCEYAIEVQ